MLTKVRLFCEYLWILIQAFFQSEMTTLHPSLFLWLPFMIIKDNPQEEEQVISFHKHNFPKKNNNILQLYQFKQLISRKKNCFIYSATSNQQESYVTIKVMPYTSTSYREMQILRECSNNSPSPNHIAKLESCFHFISLSQNYIGMVMEHCDGGSLFEMKKRNFHCITRPFIIQMLKDILMALKHVWRNNYYHRDVKLGNIMISGERHVNNMPVFKLIDFGSASSSFGKSPLVGSSQYPNNMSQKYECPMQSEGASEKSDIYALGVVALELFVSMEMKQNFDMGNSIENGIQSLMSCNTNNSDLRLVILSMLKSNPQERVDDIILEREISKLSELLNT